MKFSHILSLLLLLVLIGCAALHPDFEKPTVTVTSFRVLPSNSAVPRFEIGLHVINPNRSALTLHGLSYRADLEGHQILTGVASDLPTVPAYGEADILLQAAPDLFSTLSLFTDLMNQPRERFHFNLTAKLDVGGLLPKIRVEKSGEIRLSGGMR